MSKMGWTQVAYVHKDDHPVGSILLNCGPIFDSQLEAAKAFPEGYIAYVLMTDITKYLGCAVVLSHMELSFHIRESHDPDFEKRTKAEKKRDREMFEEDY